MRFNCLPAVVVAGALAVLAYPAQAEVTLNAGARLSHDNNVNGSPDTPTKANQRGDNYLSLNASAVYYTPLDAAQTSYFIGQAGAFSSACNQNKNLNTSMLVASAGSAGSMAGGFGSPVSGSGAGSQTFGGGFDQQQTTGSGPLSTPPAAGAGGVAGGPLQVGFQSDMSG